MRSPYRARWRVLARLAQPAYRPGDDLTMDRFDLYGALWAFCNRHHGGMGSRGYRILSRLVKAGYQPGMGLQRGRFESWEQRECYRRLLRHKESV